MERNPAVNVSPVAGLRHAGSARFGLLVAALVALAAVLPAAVLGAQQADTGAALKAAALAGRGTSPDGGPVIERVEITRVEGDYALLRLFPTLGSTDPAWLIMQRIDGACQRVRGPGAGPLVLPDDPPGGPPFSLDAYDRPYADERAAAALAGLSARLETFTGAGFSFQYDAGAGGLVQTFDDGFVQAWGSADGPATGEGFWFSLTSLGVTPDQPLDEWGYDTMVQEAERIRTQPRAGDPAGPPLSATYFHTGVADVFQIDWPFGDHSSRQLYVRSKLGGPVLRAVTTLDTAGQDPHAAEAERAAALLLATVQTGTASVEPSPGMLTSIDTYIGYAVQYPLDWSRSAFEGYGAFFRAPVGETSVSIVPQTATSIEEAVQERVDPPAGPGGRGGHPAQWHGGAAAEAAGR